MKQEFTKYKFKEGFPFEFELIVSIKDLFSSYIDVLSEPHRSDFFNITWIQKGNPTHLIDFEPVKVKENSLLFIGKNRVISYDSSLDYDGKLILFTTDFFCQNESDRKFLLSTPLFNDPLNICTIHLGKSCATYSFLYEAISEEFKKVSDCRKQYILKNYLHNLMLLAEREGQRQSVNLNIRDSDLEMVLLYKDIIEKQFRFNKCVSNYLSQLHIYEKRLNIAVANITGKTPKEIIDDRILLEAKRLLLFSDYSMKEISNEIGFDEPTNFIKYFRKHTSLTPLGFREKHKL